jgi:plastocyanin
MERDQTPATNEQSAFAIDRRRLLRCGAALGLAMPAVGTLAASAAAQEAATTTPEASPAASPIASPVASPIAAVTVKMTSQLHFEPEEVMIQRGETITWINASPIPHTTTGDPAKNPVKETRPELAQLPPGAEGWDSGLLNEGESFSHTFTVAGEYKYFCIPHVLSGMLGTITVQE